MIFCSASSIGDNGLSNFGKSLGSLSNLKCLEVDFSGYNKYLRECSLTCVEIIWLQIKDWLNWLKLFIIFILLKLLAWTLLRKNDIWNWWDWSFIRNQAVSDKGLDEVGWALSHLTKLCQISLNFTK